MTTQELKQQAREELERSNLYDSWELPSLTDKNGHLKPEWIIDKEMKDRENIALYKKGQLNNFIDSIIDRTVQHEQERIVGVIEDWTPKKEKGFYAGGGKVQVTLDDHKRNFARELLSLITNNSDINK